MQNDLLQLVRKLLDAGELPRDHRALTTGGLSAGAVCGLCATAILEGSPEIEITTTTPDQGEVTTMMHPACSMAWSAVVREVAARV